MRGRWPAAAGRPDSLNLRCYQFIDTYEDENPFLVPDAVPGAHERMFQRTIGVRRSAASHKLTRSERAHGSIGRSGGQIDAWNAAYGPEDEDGYPRRLWDLETGVIDREVAHYMRDNVRPAALPGAVYCWRSSSKARPIRPTAASSCTAARRRPSWSPFTNTDLIKRMADHIAANSPAGTSTAWHSAGPDRIALSCNGHARTEA